MSVPYSAMLLLVAAWASASLAQGTTPTTRPKGIGEMSTKEKLAEFDSLSNDRLLWSVYTKVLAQRLDRLNAPDVTPQESSQLDSLVGDLLVVVRTLTGKVGGALNDDERAYVAAFTLSRLLRTPSFGFGNEADKFHKEFFHSDVFQKSTSAYRGVAVDLLNRYEQTDMPLPSEYLIALNQPGPDSNAENGSNPTKDRIVADLYSRSGDNEKAGNWYAKLPAEFLGSLKAADAYFAARDFEKAKIWYATTSNQLALWEAKKAELATAQARYPLIDADLPKIRDAVTKRLKEIESSQKTKE